MSLLFSFSAALTQSSKLLVSLSLSLTCLLWHRHRPRLRVKHVGSNLIWLNSSGKNERLLSSHLHFHPQHASSKPTDKPGGNSKTPENYSCRRIDSTRQLRGCNVVQRLHHQSCQQSFYGSHFFRNIQLFLVYMFMIEKQYFHLSYLLSLMGLWIAGWYDRQILAYYRFTSIGAFVGSYRT